MSTPDQVRGRLLPGNAPVCIELLTRLRRFEPAPADRGQRATAAGCSCRIARTHGIPGCAAQNSATPALCGPGLSRLRIANIQPLFSRAEDLAVPGQYRSSAVTTVYPVGSAMAAFSAHVRAKLHGAIARIRLHKPDDHRPRAHDTQGSRHGRQSLFRRHVIPLRRS